MAVDTTHLLFLKVFGTTNYTNPTNFFMLNNFSIQRGMKEHGTPSPSSARVDRSPLYPNRNRLSMCIQPFYAGELFYRF